MKKEQCFLYFDRFSACVCSHRLWTGTLGRDVEIDEFFTNNHIGHTITIICNLPQLENKVNSMLSTKPFNISRLWNLWKTHRSKASSSGYILWVIHQIKQLPLLKRSLTSGESPRLWQHLKRQEVGNFAFKLILLKNISYITPKQGTCTHVFKGRNVFIIIIITIRTQLIVMGYGFSEYIIFLISRTA